MKAITKIFLTGLATVLPVVATFYLLYWLILTIESAFGTLLKLVLTENYYVPGLGIVLGVLFIFLVGILMRSWLAQFVFALWEGFLLRLPIIKSVYSTLQDFFGFFSRSRTAAAQQVVSVRLKGQNMRLIGFVTRENLRDLPEGLNAEDEIAVYLPMSYQMGGYTVLLPREDVQPVDISVEDAMRFAITAGISIARGEKAGKDKDTG
ncbi:MAG: DUF502 domain-containing protein [Gammaproteobacteria bacterium]|nr:DUF502 domain-containing protein [Gammaproteobacteria bacterium]